MSYPANDPMDPREREVASDEMWHLCADCNAAGAEFRLKRDRYLCDECAARLHAQEIAVIQELLSAPKEPEPAICEFCTNPMPDTDGHGLGECVPVCDRCDGSGVDPADVKRIKPSESPTEPAQDMRGLFDKFTVTRHDGADKLGGKHDGCDYFVLDLTHDKHAKAAILAYADACEKDRPQLAKDLRDRMGWAQPPAEPAQDDEAAIEAWGRSMLVHTVGELESDSTPYFASLVRRRAEKGLGIMRSFAREKADLRAEVERLRTIITAAATQIRVAHEKEDEGAPCAASNHYEEALNMLADHAGAWSPECAKLRDFTTLGMVCKENSDLRAALIECGEIVGASVSEKCSSTFLCDVAGEVRLQVEKISAANAELRAKLAAAEQETKRLRSALRIADDIIVRGDDPSGNEPEDVCQIIESFVVVRAKLADAHEQLRCPDCGCATPEEAEAGECGCDSPVCSVEVTTTVAKELCDVAKKLAAAEAHQSDRPLIPGNLIDRIDEHGQEWTRTERVRSTVAELVQPQTVEDITRLREKLAAAEERIAEMRGIAKGFFQWTVHGESTKEMANRMRRVLKRIAELGKGGA